jgi:large subunit ribosomal protein L3
MKTLIAKKVGMTQIFDEDSNAKGVTVLDISGCRVVQVKSAEKDGYSAAQLTIGSNKKANRPTQRHYDKYNVEPGECLYEVPIDVDSEIKSGKELNVSEYFEVGQKIDITGFTKGHGFTGVMKRHNFSGQKASHGVHKVHRAGGSIGNASYPVYFEA